MNLTSREPLAIRAAITAAITGLIHVLVVTGVLGIDADSEGAIAGAVDVVGALVLTLWSRASVTPVATLPPDVDEPRNPDAIPASELIARYGSE
ncbi:hypothetical protein RHODO2019_10975 [Rhodococcus antarcticus]|uniref:Uncharacterized protein n=1 Tax=Rhodococcus antarcticus TaxID=2987751 RepID=A0ABY6NXM0_9NOCA|nr:hypothetical protein [Rhodococcus antarcticus]UZJ23728.1 hypothetical protein RHODO2019_10975 [Rhodococcus antarcticus]